MGKIKEELLWTKYDGTPETLPAVGPVVLLKCYGEECVEVYGYSFDPTSQKKPAWICEFDKFDIHKPLNIGDLWAFWPNPL